MFISSIQSIHKMLSLDQATSEIYCRIKRQERYNKYGGRIRFLPLHSFIHHFLLPVLTINRKIARQNLVILRDSRKKYDGPLIYCPTHIGGIDIECAFEIIKHPCWLVLGDPRELYHDVSGMMLQMNGWIPLDTLVKRDRTVAKAQMDALLAKGGNLLIFPEGAQNVSFNLILNHLYSGAVELAITHHAQIVPIAIEWDNNTYYSIVGENIDYSNCSWEDRYKLTTALRDRLAALKWEITEQLPALKRSEITEKTYQEYLDRIFDLNAGYSWTVEDILKTQFHPKGVTSPKEAFSFMDNLIPSGKNAFLFRRK